MGLVVPTQMLLVAHPSAHIVSASREAVWAWGQEMGQQSPNKARLCPAGLRTGRSMGYKQPRETLRRRVNKGISEEVSELGPTGPRWGK